MKKPNSLMVITIEVLSIVTVLYLVMTIFVGVYYGLTWLSVALAVPLIPLTVLLAVLIRTHLVAMQALKVQRFALEEYAKWKQDHPDVDIEYFQENVLPEIIKERFNLKD